MYRQPILPLKFSEPVTFDEVLQTETNHHALKWLRSWPQNTSDVSSFTYLTGSQSELLSYIWSIQNQAQCISMRDTLLECWHRIMRKKIYNKCYLIKLTETIKEEELLLYMLNSISEQHSYLLLASNIHPSNLHIKLPDLKSRLLTIGIITC